MICMFNQILETFKNNIEWSGVGLIDNSVKIELGERSSEDFKIEIGQGVVLKNLIIQIAGKNNRLVIGDNVSLRGGVLSSP